MVRGFEMTADDHLRKAVIGALMCNGTLDIVEVERTYGIDFAATFGAELADLDKLAVDNLVRRTPARIDITELGRLLVRRVAMVFDRYLRDDAARQQPAPGAANDATVVPLVRYSRVV